MFGLNEFKAVIGKRGLAKPTHFCVNITPPAGLFDPVIADLPFLVSTTNLPGVQFQNEQYRHKGYGLAENRPVQAQFDDITMTIIGDGQGRVLKFLQDWLNFVHNMDGDASEEDGVIPAETFNYPNEYWGTIDLYLYDIAGENYQIYKCRKAHPSNLGGVQLGWEQIDQLMLISITFTYRSYGFETIDTLSQSTYINTLSSNQYRNVNALENLLQNPNLTDYQNRFSAL